MIRFWLTSRIKGHVVSDVAPKPPGLFTSTASLYARYRPPYAPVVLDFLVERFQLGRSTMVLDLGCGTGHLAIPLSARSIPVRAIDPDLEMLAEGMRAEARAGVSGVAWQRGSDATLETLFLPRLRACVMGASFHWMSRNELLRKLDRMIEPGGGIAVLSGTGSVWNTDTLTRWTNVAKEVVVDMLGPVRRAGAGTYDHPKERHEEVLGHSAFSHVESRTFRTPERLDVDAIVGLQLSTSYASPAHLGVRVDEFKKRLAARLYEVEPSGVFEGTRVTDVLVATR